MVLEGPNNTSVSSSGLSWLSSAVRDTRSSSPSRLSWKLQSLPAQLPSQRQLPSSPQEPWPEQPASLQVALP